MYGSGLQLHKTRSHDLDTCEALTSFEYSIYRAFQKEGLRTFIRLLNECFELNEADVAEAFHRILRFPSSTFISAHKVLFLSAESNICCVFVHVREERFLQRIVSTDNYYGSGTEIFDVFMVETNTDKVLANFSKGKTHLWYPNVILIVQKTHTR